MAYKYQNEIENVVDVMVKVMGEEKHQEVQQELAEVYRKAEAYDGNPVKPIEAGMDEAYAMFHECPECEEEEILYGYNFCPVCGVRLDWGDSQ